MMPISTYGRGRVRGRGERNCNFVGRSQSADIYTRDEQSKKGATYYEAEMKRKSLLEARLGLPGLQSKRYFGSESGSNGRRISNWDTNSITAHESVSQTGPTTIEHQLVSYQATDVTTGLTSYSVGGRVGYETEHHNLRQKYSMPEPSTLNYGASYAQNQLNAQNAYDRRVKQPQFANLQDHPPGPISIPPRSAPHQLSNRDSTTVQNGMVSHWMRPGIAINEGLYNHPRGLAKVDYGSPEVHSIPKNNSPHPPYSYQWIPTETCLKAKFFTSAFLPEPYGPGTAGGWFMPRYGEIDIYGLIELRALLRLIYQAHGIRAHVIIVVLEVEVGQKTFHVNLASPQAEVDWVMIMGHIQLGGWPGGKITATMQQVLWFGPENKRN